MILLPAISEDKRQLVSGPGERPSPSSVCWTKARSVASSARHGTTPSQCLSFTGIKLVYYILVHAGFSSDRAWVHCGGDEKQRTPEFLILLALVWYGGMRKWYANQFDFLRPLAGSISMSTCVQTCPDMVGHGWTWLDTAGHGLFRARKWYGMWYGRPLLIVWV